MVRCTREAADCGRTSVGDQRKGASPHPAKGEGYQFNPRLKASIGTQYFSQVGHDVLGDVDALRSGVTVDYEIVQNFNAKLAVNYSTFDTPAGDLDQWHGFLRFDRKF
ncbi:porin [Chelativorans sp. J32]|uniref:porin n=1 Tax=Chelativorans sp. J32 TaxID=935840 RepID=UPI0012EC8E7C|nr:porin [Chelativorans sp. J32]